MAIMPDLLCRRPTPSAAAAVESLKRLGVAPERVDLVPISALESFKGEVVGQIPHPGAPLDPAGHVTLFVSRNGLAERLPHDFLEPLPSTEDESRVAIEPGQVMEYWERQVAAYAPGRQFVTVIDRALSRLDKVIDRVGLSLSAATTDPSFAWRVLRVLGHDGLPLTEEECLFLAVQAQRFHLRCGVIEGMSALLGYLLGIPVEVVERPGPTLDLPPSSRRPLGGDDAVLGGGLPLAGGFTDPVPTLQVRLGPVPLVEFDALDTDPRWHQRVETFLDAIAPAGSATEYVLLLREQDRGTVLADRLRSRLDRTTYV